MDYTTIILIILVIIFPTLIPLLLILYGCINLIPIFLFGLAFLTAFPMLLLGYDDKSSTRIVPSLISKTEPSLISKRANNDNFMFMEMSKLLLKNNKTYEDIVKFKNKADKDDDILINNRGICLKCPGYESEFKQISKNDFEKLNCENIGQLVDNVECDQLEEYREERKKENTDHANLLIYQNKLSNNYFN